MGYHGGVGRGCAPPDREDPVFTDEFEAMMVRELEDERHAMPATPGDAHREWHINAGVPMGQPGCPQDACHPVEEPSGPPPTQVGVRCGNASHPNHFEGWMHHASAAEVRECYADSGRFA